MGHHDVGVRRERKAHRIISAGRGCGHHVAKDAVGNRAPHGTGESRGSGEIAHGRARPILRRNGHRERFAGILGRRNRRPIEMVNLPGQPVVIDDRSHGLVVGQGRVDRIGEDQKERLIRLDPGVADDFHLDRLVRFTRQERQDAVGRHIINRREGRPVAGGVTNRNRLAVWIGEPHCKGEGRSVAAGVAFRRAHIVNRQ